MAVAEGFEPSDGGYPSHAFEACSLGRSDTPPPVSLPADPNAHSRCPWLFAQALITVAARRTPPRAQHTHRRALPHAPPGGA